MDRIASIDYMYLLGLFMLGSGMILVIFYSLKGIKENIKERRSIVDKSLKFYNKLDEIISKTYPLNKVKQTLQLKYGVINSSTENKNRVAAVKTIFYLSIVSFILILLFYALIKVWYMVLIIAIGMVIFPYILLFTILNFRLDKLKQQFPNAVNIFITKYTTEKNKDKALQKTYEELQYPIRYEFRRLSKQMASKSNVKGAIEGFGRRMEYIWAELFGDLLMLNHETVDDIGDELNELSMVMMQDQALEADKKAETNVTKAVNIFVVIFVIGVVVINIAMLKEAAINIYFERFIGTLSITAAIITIILCMALTLYYEKF